VVQNHTDTIAAIITPPGRGGVGIIRLSGKTLKPFFVPLLGVKPTARKATLTPFLDLDHQEIDRGLVLYFPAPGSFTGEETMELHAHGSPVVLDQLMSRIIDLGARQARPGEFSERAFLNGKLDLAQAEAIADLIDATTLQAARGAVRTLKGDFSKRINALMENLTKLRVYIEASIDFPEEEVDFLSDGKVESDLQTIIAQTRDILKNTGQGVLLKEGMSVAIAGKPNAGKSSLLNALAEYDRAIVTDVPGTTRDVLIEQINVDGLIVHIIDTAGLRESEDSVEREGIRRAWQQISEADRVLWVVDSSIESISNSKEEWPEYRQRFPERKNVTTILNKIDLNESNDWSDDKNGDVIHVSTLTGQGLDNLKAHLKTIAGYSGEGEGVYMARRRHLSALGDALDCVVRARLHLIAATSAGELVAEELRQAQQQLGLITGAFSSDELLGEIFSSFCIGK